MSLADVSVVERVVDWVELLAAEWVDMTAVE